MPTFMTVHRAPGLSREEFQANAPAVVEAKHARPRQVYANILDGFIVTIYEADDQAALEREFERLGFPFDEIHEVQVALTGEDLARMAQGGGPAH